MKQWQRKRYSKVARGRKAAYRFSMRQYERYLFSHLLWPTVVICASLTGLVWLMQTLKFLDFMVSRGLTVGDFLILTGLMLPSLLVMLIPISLAIGVIYTYNKLMVESELIVLGAVGVSRWQLAKPALTLGAFACLLCYGLALYLMPLANARFQDIRVFFRDKYASVLLEEEVFNNPMDGVTVYARARDGQNLQGILMHDSRDPNQTITMVADHGKVEQTENGPRFYLENGIRQQWKNGRVNWLAFDNYTMDIAFFGQEVTRKRSEAEQTIFELFNREGLTDKQIAAYRAEAHQRLTWPLLCLGLPLLVVAVLFAGEFNRRGQSRRIVAASLVVLVLVLAYFALRSLSVKHAWLVSGMYLIGFGVIAAGSYMLTANYNLRWRSNPALMPQAGG